MREAAAEHIPCDVKAGAGKSMHTPVKSGERGASV